MIAAGSLKHQVTLQRLSKTVNASGQKVEAWTDLNKVRAGLRQRTTREFVRDFGENDTAITVFTIRYYSGLTNTDRVLFEGVAFDIKEIAEIGTKTGLELRCEAVK